MAGKGGEERVTVGKGRMLQKCRRERLRFCKGEMSEKSMRKHGELKGKTEGFR